MKRIKHITARMAERDYKVEIVATITTGKKTGLTRHEFIEHGYSLQNALAAHLQASGFHFHEIKVK